MLAVVVLVLTPVVDNAAHVATAGETALQQAFIPQAAVEALDVGLLNWLAWLDEAQLYAVPGGPVLYGAARELRADIRADDLVRAPRGLDLIKHAHNVQRQDEVSTAIWAASFVQSLTTVGVLTLRPLTSSSNTKSMLHTSLGCSGRTSG